MRCVLPAVLAAVLSGCVAPSPAGPSPSGPSPSGSAAPATSSSPAPPPDPDGLSPVQATRVDAVLAGMDRRARVAQLFVVGVPLGDLGAGDAPVADGVGGVFLAGRSTAPAGDLAAVTSRWADAAPGVRPWVAADQEGGQVQSLSGPGFGRLPPALAQGRLPPGELAALAYGMGASLSAAGVTLDLAPVADVVPPGRAAGNAPIGAVDRQYGGTAAQVVRAAGTVVRGLSAHGVTAALKHFPGLGAVTGNTDTTAVVTDRTTTADDDQVAVFGELARLPQHPLVMVSSATYTRIDGSAPAVFSPAVLDLLRDRLGFRGVAISDDLGNARAVQAVAPGERAVRFLTARGTLVLTARSSLLPRMRDAVLARDAADPGFAATVDSAVRTALSAKVRAGLLPG